jgi:hypothetical protein
VAVVVVLITVLVTVVQELVETEHSVVELTQRQLPTVVLVAVETAAVITLVLVVLEL